MTRWGTDRLDNSAPPWNACFGVLPVLPVPQISQCTSAELTKTFVKCDWTGKEFFILLSFWIPQYHYNQPLRPIYILLLGYASPSFLASFNFCERGHECKQKYSWKGEAMQKIFLIIKNKIKKLKVKENKYLVSRVNEGNSLIGWWPVVACW